MLKRGLSQETLKIIACVTMLLDHIGFSLLPGIGLRTIGRLSFPIFCFLLSEGIHYTKRPGRYAARLTSGMILAELPFDLLFFGTFTWAHQSVMVTLLLAFIMGRCMMQTDSLWVKILFAVPFALLAQMMHTDYGAAGVLLVAAFILTRDLHQKILCQTLAVSLLLQPLAALAMIPIGFYNPEKRVSNRWIQLGCYLFYPAHLLLLYLITNR